MIDESPRQIVYDAIDREREFRGEEDYRSIGEWIDAARRELDGARGRWLALEYPVCRMKLLQATAILVACLDQHLGQECEHDWWAKSVVEGGGVSEPYWNYVGVRCRKCWVDGKVKNLGLHELKLTSSVCYAGDCRWYDPDRVIIEEN